MRVAGGEQEPQAPLMALILPSAVGVHASLVVKFVVQSLCSHLSKTEPTAEAVGSAAEVTRTTAEGRR